MANMIDGQSIKEALLESISRNAGNLQTRTVLEQTINKLGIRNNDTTTQQAVLTIFHDLFLSGQLGWGHDALNANPPFFHITERGRQMLRDLSRDPANPDGYLHELSRRATVNAVALSYIQEGLRTYNAQCYKSAAVMVGAASESIVSALRDSFVARLQQLHQQVLADLTDWRALRVLRSLQREFDARKHQMPNELWEKYEGFWSSFTQQIRSARNEAGHPVSIDPVTRETVHASLLIFPELASMATELTTWISSMP